MRTCKDELRIIWYSGIIFLNLESYSRILVTKPSFLNYNSFLCMTLWKSEIAESQKIKKCSWLRPGVQSSLCAKKREYGQFLGIFSLLGTMY